MRVLAEVSGTDESDRTRVHLTLLIEKLLGLIPLLTDAGVLRVPAPYLRQLRNIQKLRQAHSTSFILSMYNA